MRKTTKENLATANGIFTLVLSGLFAFAWLILIIGSFTFLQYEHSEYRGNGYLETYKSVNVILLIISITCFIYYFALSCFAVMHRNDPHNKVVSVILLVMSILCWFVVTIVLTIINLCIVENEGNKVVSPENLNSEPGVKYLRELYASGVLTEAQYKEYLNKHLNKLFD